MKTYVVKIRWNGRTFQDSIQAYSSGDVRKIMEMRYPGASIYGITEQR